MKWKALNELKEVLQEHLSIELNTKTFAMKVMVLK